MCARVNEYEDDAIQAYAGNKSAGLRFRKALREIEILCVDLRNALFEHSEKKMVGQKRKHGDIGEGVDPNLEGGGKEDGLDSLSCDEDFDDDDMDRDLDSDLECNVENTRPANEVHEYQFFKKDVEIEKGPEKFDTDVRMELGGQRLTTPPQMPQVSPPPSVLAPHFTPGIHFDSHQGGASIL